MAKVIRKGKSHVGKIEVILTDSHLGSTIERCILMDAIVPKREYAGDIWEVDAKFVKQLKTQLRAAA